MQQGLPPTPPTPKSRCSPPPTAMHNSSYHLPWRGLPRELRDLIYTYLFKLPDGISISQEKSHRAARSQRPIPLSILRANRQTHAEASAILWGRNELVLHLNIMVATDWLTDSIRRQVTMKSIKSITLGKEVMNEYIGSRKHSLFVSSKSAGELCHELVYRIGVERVCVHVPENSTPPPTTLPPPPPPPGQPGNIALPHPNSLTAGLQRRIFRFPLNDYCWKIPKELVDTLMVDETLREVRLVYPAPLDEGVNVDKLDAVKLLRRAEDDFERDSRERRVRKAFECGHRSEFANQDAMEKWLKSQRRMHNFVVERCPEEPAVLVLKKRKAPGAKTSDSKISGHGISNDVL